MMGPGLSRNTFPPEIWYQIAEKLEPQDYINVKCLNSEFNSFFSSQLLTDAVFKNIYGSISSIHIADLSEGKRWKKAALEKRMKLFSFYSELKYRLGDRGDVTDITLKAFRSIFLISSTGLLTDVLDGLFFDLYYRTGYTSTFLTIPIYASSLLLSLSLHLFAVYKFRDFFVINFEESFNQIGRNYSLAKRKIKQHCSIS